MNGIEYDICYTQQRIYEHMASEKYDMRVFSDAYLKCDFCRRAMDTCYSRFQLEDVYECMDFYMPEIGASLVKMMEDKTSKLQHGSALCTGIFLSALV